MREDEGAVGGARSRRDKEGTGVPPSVPAAVEELRPPGLGAFPTNKRVLSKREEKNLAPGSPLILSASSPFPCREPPPRAGFWEGEVAFP